MRQFQASVAPAGDCRVASLLAMTANRRRTHAFGFRHSVHQRSVPDVIRDASAIEVPCLLLGMRARDPLGGKVPSVDGRDGAGAMGQAASAVGGRSRGPSACRIAVVPVVMACTTSGASAPRLSLSGRRPRERISVARLRCCRA